MDMLLIDTSEAQKRRSARARPRTRPGSSGRKAPDAPPFVTHAFRDMVKGSVGVLSTEHAPGAGMGH